MLSNYLPSLEQSQVLDVIKGIGLDGVLWIPQNRSSRSPCGKRPLPLKNTHGTLQYRSLLSANCNLPFLNLVESMIWARHAIWKQSFGTITGACVFRTGPGIGSWQFSCIKQCIKLNESTYIENFHSYKAKAFVWWNSAITISSIKRNLFFFDDLCDFYFCVYIINSILNKLLCFLGRK